MIEEYTEILHMHGSKQVKEGNSELLIRSSEPEEYVHLERKWVGGYASSLKLNLTDPLYGRNIGF